MSSSASAVGNSGCVRGVPLLRKRGIQLSERVERRAAKARMSAQVDVVVAPVRLSVSQVKDLKDKPTGVRREEPKTATKSVKRRTFFRLLASIARSRVRESAMTSVHTP